LRITLFSRFDLPEQTLPSNAETALPEQALPLFSFQTISAAGIPEASPFTWGGFSLLGGIIALSLKGGAQGIRKKLHLKNQFCRVKI
jgi:hypothetical protein